MSYWTRSDLRRYPELREMLLLEEVRSGRLPPVQALRELIELRPPSASPLSDRYLLASLWPRGLATAGEAAQLLWLLDGDLRGTPALELLDHALQPPHRNRRRWTHGSTCALRPWLIRSALSCRPPPGCASRRCRASATCWTARGTR